MSDGDTGVGQHSMDAFEQELGVDAEGGTEYFSDLVRLPGYWEAEEECERCLPTGFCEDGHIQLGGEEPCRRRKCPHHWYRWRQQAAEKIVARLAAYRLAQEDGLDRRMLHVAASPPQDRRWTAERFWGMRREAYDKIQKFGGRGGVFIPHAYRVGEDAERMWVAAVRHGDVEKEYGKWRFTRSITDDWDHMQKGLVEAAPHGHALVPWRDLDGDEIREELEEGWVIHNVRSLAPIYLEEDNVPWKLRAKKEKTAETIVDEGFEDMGRLVMYLLSHAAVQIPVGERGEPGYIAGKQTVTYFGEVHGNSFDPEEELADAVWKKIQRKAAEAVGLPPEGDDEDGGVDPEQECQREECEALVRPLGELEEYLSDVREYEGWFEGLDFEQQCEIWGLWTWRGDKPPPGGGDSELPPGGFQRSPSVADEVREDRESFIEWLRRLGRARLGQKPGYSMAGA